jgi:hypothetical protein
LSALGLAPFRRVFRPTSATLGKSFEPRGRVFLLMFPFCFCE